MNTNNNTILFLIGRILVGSFYLYTGLDNFIHLTEKIGYATFKGVPVPTLGVVVGRDLYYVANSQWERFGEDGHVANPAALLPPTVLRLRL